MRLFILCVLLLVSFSSFSQSYKRICVVGSSTTYGCFPAPSPAYSQDSGWVGKIKKHYKALGIVDTVFNLGCVGKDCYSGMPSSYIPPAGENYPDPVCNISAAVSKMPKPDVIIINYPSNNFDRISNEDIIRCFQTMKDTANVNGIRCFIATSQPRNSFDEQGKQKLKALRDTIVAVFGFWAIDFFTPVAEEPLLTILPAYDLGDYIHLNPAGHTVLANQVIAKNIFTFVLPVKLQNFSAKTTSNRILLQWTTLEETNADYFYIERSSNGNSFETVATINAIGNSTIARRYNYLDYSINNNGFFYRLISVSNNGYPQISPVCFVPSGCKKFSVKQFYPTLAVDFIHTLIAVEGKQMITVEIIDAVGRQLKSEQILVDIQLEYAVKISGFSKGNYFVRFKNKDQLQTMSFSKQ